MVSRLYEQAQQVAVKLLEQPELAFHVCSMLLSSKLAGPWERNSSLRILGRRVPTSPTHPAVYVVNIDYDGSWFEWRARRPTEDIIQGPTDSIAEQSATFGRGRATNLRDAVRAADHRLREDGWRLIGEPAIGGAWSTPLRNADTHEILPCSVRRENVEDGTDIAVVTFGQFDRPIGFGSSEAQLVEGCRVVLPTFPHVDVGVIPRRDGEDVAGLFNRAMNLADGKLRSANWLLEPGTRRIDP